MTSKEALNELLYHATLDDSGFEPYMKEYANQIEKDLEILEQYKDIEEKLEIDVPTYFKYVGSEKAFVKDDNGYIEECYVMGGTLDSIILMQVAFPYGECELTRKFKYYGEQWALTIEELENELNS